MLVLIFMDDITMEKINNLKGQTNLPLYKEAYTKWNDMHSRVRNNKNYSTVTISNEWYTFSNFYSWFVENYTGSKSHLDKDIKGGRVYSADNCILMPGRVNQMFKGDYGSVGKGVRVQSNGRYQAQATWDGEYKSFGTYDTSDEATTAYEVARKKRLYDLSVQYSQYPELSAVLLSLSK